MPYCHSCKVSLADSEQVCPLCGALPTADEKSHIPAPPFFAAKFDAFPARISRRFLVRLVIGIILIPLAAVVTIDLLVSHGLR